MTSLQKEEGEILDVYVPLEVLYLETQFSAALHLIQSPEGWLREKIMLLSASKAIHSIEDFGPEAKPVEESMPSISKASR